ncbi:MAG: uncharacterized membrane protein HdeD (DUF308 family) [Cyclobacteriaceae bacterium]|jgi:uncharacterized membrane protein HdeD (DUF308 family)
MKKHLPILLYGAIAIFVGIFLLLSDYSSFNVLKLTLGISLIIGAISSFVGAYSSHRGQVAFAYHQMHALATIVYGVSILVFGSSLERLISITALFFFFYAFSEIILCLRLFELATKVVYKIAALRFILGLAIGLGTVVAMHFSKFTLEGFGVLFVILGVNIMLYAPVMKVGNNDKIQYSNM